MLQNFGIYSNENVLNTLTSMISSGRLSQSFLFFGPKGLGKKTIALYFAKTLLCEHKGTYPCNECRSCRNIDKNVHPDVKVITTKDNPKAFSVDNLRALTTDAYIAPNDSERKVYILADCDTMSPLSQNTLLKLIEEPPEHAYFIFTASSKAVFLPTILSRVISLGMSEVSHEQCADALEKNGVTDKNEIEHAIEAFGGNIGMCLEYIHSDELKNAVSIACSITDAIAGPSEYKLLSALNELDSNKPLTKAVISLLYSIIRDSCVIRLHNDELIGCYKKGSAALAQTITLGKAYDIYTILSRADARLDGNASLSLTLADICARIKSN